MAIIITFVNLLFRLLELAILAECIMSWVVRGSNPIMEALRAFTAPILNPCRRLQDRFLGQVPIDFSPILALVLLDLLRGLIFGILL